MIEICREQYEKDFDEMFKLDKNGLMTNIDCYVSNLENKIERLNNIIDELEKAILTTYPCMDAYDRDFKTELLYILKKRKELKGELNEQRKFNKSKRNGFKSN